MRIRLLLPTLLLGLAAPLAAQSLTPSPSAAPAPGGPTGAPTDLEMRGHPLAARLLARMAAVPGARVGLAYIDLGRGDTLMLGADTAFHAASTMKVPVMIELFRQADEGRLSLDDPLVLRNEFASIVDGSPYALDAADDSDSTLYARIGTGVPIRELLERMIVRSSNLATNVVIELVGAESVRRTSAALGAPEMRVLRGVEDGKAYAAGLSNSTTARSLAALLAALERGEAASPAATEEMRGILLRQEFNAEIPAGVPAGTRVAHKTGFITATLHDGAIVYPAGGTPYVLVVLTGRIPERQQARELIADLSRMVYEHHAIQR